MYSTIMYASRASRGATAARRSSTKGRAMLRHLEDTVLSLVLLAAVSFLPNYTTAFLFPPTTTGHLLGCCQPLASATQSSLSTGCPATFMRPAHSSSGSSTQQQQLGISNSRSNRSRACYSRAHARSKRRGHTSLRMASEGMGESMVDAEADAGTVAVMMCVNVSRAARLELSAVGVSQAA